MIFAQDLVILFPNKENWGFKSPFIKLLKVRLICVDLHAKNLSVLCLTVGCKWPNMHMIVRGCKLRCTSLFGLATVRMKMLNIFINCCFLSLVISSRLKDLICPMTWHLDWPAAQKEERKKKKQQKKTNKKTQTLPFYGALQPEKTVWTLGITNTHLGHKQITIYACHGFADGRAGVFVWMGVLMCCESVCLLHF